MFHTKQCTFVVFAEDEEEQEGPLFTHTPRTAEAPSQSLHLRRKPVAWKHSTFPESPCPIHFVQSTSLVSTRPTSYFHDSHWSIFSTSIRPSFSGPNTPNPSCIIDLIWRPQQNVRVHHRIFNIWTWPNPNGQKSLAKPHYEGWGAILRNPHACRATATAPCPPSTSSCWTQAVIDSPHRTVSLMLSMQIITSDRSHQLNIAISMYTPHKLLCSHLVQNIEGGAFSSDSDDHTIVEDMM